MKRVTALFVTAALALTMAACGSPASSVPAASTPADSDAAPKPLTEVVAEMYALYTPDVMAPETVALDLGETDWASYHTGLDETQLAEVTEGALSQSATGSQAYSLVLLRLQEGTDAAAMGETLLENAPADKWICVWPDKAVVTGKGDVVCCILADTELVDTQALVDAFAEVMGGTDLSLEHTYEEGEAMADAGDLAVYPVPDTDGADSAAVPEE